MDKFAYYEAAFVRHNSIFCRTLSNVIIPFEHYPIIRPDIGKKEKEIIINTFVNSHFMYCQLALHFCSKSSQNKIETNSVCVSEINHR